MLDMIVCHHCYEEAQKLSLYTEELGFNSAPAPRHEMMNKA